MKPQILLTALASLIIGGALGYLFSPSSQNSSEAPNLLGSTGSCSAGGESAGPLVQVEGKSFELADLPTELRTRLYEYDSERFQKAQSTYKEFAMRLLMAKEKGLPTEPEKLPALTDMLSSKKAGEKQARAFFNARKSALPPGAKFEDMKDQIIAHLSLKED